MVMLKISIRTVFIVWFSFLSTLLFAQSKVSAYSDLNDIGYKGQIKSITTKFYDKISSVNGNWVIQDTVKPKRKTIKYFNADGNFTRVTNVTETDSSNTIYEYENNVQIGWKDLDSKGTLLRTAKFTNNDSGFTESSYKLNGKLESEEIYFLDKGYRTTRIINKSYDEDNRLSFYMVTDFQSDKDGHLYKMVMDYKMQHTTNSYEMTILNKDQYGNPTKFLVIKDNIPTEIRLISIAYEQ